MDLDKLKDILDKHALHATATSEEHARLILQDRYPDNPPVALHKVGDPERPALTPEPLTPEPSTDASSHTPGPWEATEEDTFEMECRAIMDQFGERLCHVETWEDMEEDSKEQAEANARLIAAAPDMLEALKEAREELMFDDAYSELYDKIDAAIQKATPTQD